MYDPQPRPPAPNLSPDEMLTCVEFELSGVDTFQEAQEIDA